MLNHKNEITASKCPKCDTAYKSEDGRVSVNESKCANCGASLHENNILAIENHIRILQFLKDPFGFKLKNKCETFKGFLKPETKIILNNLDNYLIRDRYAGSSICRYCNKRIAQSFLPLIL